jgi:hypothetical protein
MNLLPLIMNGSQSYAPAVSKEQWPLQKNVGKEQAPNEGPRLALGLGLLQFPARSFRHA